MGPASLGAFFPLAARNGSLVPIEDLTVHVESQAMRYALSVFEGMRGYLPSAGRGERAVMFEVRAHLERLASSLLLAGLAAEDEAREIERQADEALEALLVEVGPAEDVYARVAVSAASAGDLGEPAGLETTITLRSMGRKKWLRDGGGLVVSVGPRKGPGELLSHQCKCVSHYAGARRALLEAKANGYDSVVLRTFDGRLAEAPTANVFAVFGSEVVTPPLADAALAGITRLTVLRLAGEAGLSPTERSLWPDDIAGADEVFLCGTGLEIAPVATFDGRELPAPGQVTRALTQAFFSLVRGAGP